MSRVKNVAEWLDASAQRFPDKIAFSDGTNVLTFAELRNAARRIGSELARRGFFKQPIFIALGQEPRTIAAFLGCAYSGNFYVPLDLEMPRERVDKIKAKISPALTINKDNYEQLATSPLAEDLLEKAFARQIDADLAYMFFTSGSTGIPKSVAIPHRGIIDYTDKVCSTFGFDENTIFGQINPFIADSSVFQIYQTLLCGSTDMLFPKTTLMFPSTIINFMNDFKIDTIFCSPYRYTVIAKSGIFKKRKPQYLTKCLFSGEVMPNAILNIWRKALPDALYVNIMGPTEITDAYCYYIVDREFADDEPLPVGKTYPNVEALIFNEQNKLCQTNEIGEICIRGSKLSYGYYNDPDKTAEVFVQNPLNTAYPEIIYRTGDLGYINERGEIMFVGRKDFQIKHRSARIEPQDIESAVISIDDVELCACTYDSDKQEIVLFYCGKIAPDDLKKLLKTKLEPYKIPAKFYQLDTLPQTATGKIDRKALKAQLGTMLASTPTH